MSLIALGLRIPESKGGKDFFKGMHDYEVPNGTVTRLLYYPPLPDEFGQGGQEDGYTRIGAHCDIGGLSMSDLLR